MEDKRKRNKGSIKKGEVRNPRGRGKGTPNRTTSEIRDNISNMNKWLEEVAEDDPNKALDMMLKLSEYFIPKLARQELTGADGKDLFKDIKFEFGD
jgi:hypothetical protein